MVKGWSIQPVHQVADLTRSWARRRQSARMIGQPVWRRKRNPLGDKNI